MWCFDRVLQTGQVIVTDLLGLSEALVSSNEALHNPASVGSLDSGVRPTCHAGDATYAVGGGQRTSSTGQESVQNEVGPCRILQVVLAGGEASGTSSAPAVFTRAVPC